VEDQKMRVNSANEAISLTRPPSQVLFYPDFNIEKNFAALFVVILFCIPASTRKSRTTFASMQYLVLHAKLEQFSILS